jgi:4-hydroxy-tetrahydrodipicolinate synthase
MQRSVASFRGSAASLPTPYRFGRVDYDAFERLCRRLVERGTTGIVPCSAIGEAALLTPAERHQLVATAVAVARGRVPVLAAIGGGNTATAIELACSAEAAGASAILCDAPIYLEPSLSDVIAHFEAVHDAVHLPIVLDDVRSRTACTLSDIVVKRLSVLPRLVGLVDESSDISRVARLRRRVGHDFLLLSGCDALQSAFRQAGGHGSVSVMANVVPALCAALHRAHDECRADEIRRLGRVLAPLDIVLSLEPGPAAVKRALLHLKLIDNDGTRLPVSALGSSVDRRLAAILERIEIAESEEALRFAAAHPLIAPRAA